MTKLSGVCVGAGYFSRFQYEAWNRIPEVRIVALCNRDREKAVRAAEEFHISSVYGYDAYEEMLERERPDFVDIITPPETHLFLVEAAAARGIAVICQKPLAPGMEESCAVVEAARRHEVRFMVHENWRWQPWYREMKRHMEEGLLGELFSLHAFMRAGDGWPEDAYLARQPFFRTYPRLLVYETGVHFLDTFRYLGGEIETIYARLQQRNSAIVGEDAGQIVAGFQGGATAILDASRYNEAETDNPRYTFGTFRVDGSKGHIRLDLDGTLIHKSLGQAPRQIPYEHDRTQFAGGCVERLQRHFVDCMLTGEPFESTGEDYLKTVALVEACYRSHETGSIVNLDPETKPETGTT